MTDGAQGELLRRVSQMDDIDAELALADLENAEQLRKALRRLLVAAEARVTRKGRDPRQNTLLFFARRVLERAENGWHKPPDWRSESPWWNW